MYLMFIYILLTIAIIFGFYLYISNEKIKKDVQLLAQDLQERIENQDIPDVEDDFIINNMDGILAMASLNKGVAEKRENMTFSHPANTRYWPYYYYAYPYQYKTGGAWPPGLFSRMYNWQPGFQTSGWSFWLRPGMYYDKWPRNRWIRNNNRYYFINNGKDRVKDYM